MKLGAKNWGEKGVYTSKNSGFILFLLNPIQTGGGGGLFEPPLRQNRDNSYTERAMTFEFSDFS